MNKKTTLIPSLCIFLLLLFTKPLTANQSDGVQPSTLYASTTAYAASESGYVHIGSYDNFRIFTDLSPDRFGEQAIVDRDNQLIFENEGRSDYLLYPYFFILVNYYDTFEVVTLSPWSFDGIDALINVNKQYIQFYN